MNYLFICKYNRFRSKVAECYFKKINKANQVKSAGLLPGIPIDEKIKNTAKKQGINVVGKPKGLDYSLLLWANKVIIVGNDVPISILDVIKGEKEIISWRIPDVDDNDIQGRIKTIKKIQKRVDQLMNL